MTFAGGASWKWEAISVLMCVRNWIKAWKCLYINFRLISCLDDVLVSHTLSWKVFSPSGLENFPREISFLTNGNFLFIITPTETINFSCARKCHHVKIYFSFSSCVWCDGTRRPSVPGTWKPPWNHYPHMIYNNRAPDIKLQKWWKWKSMKIAF